MEYFLIMLKISGLALFYPILAGIIARFTDKNDNKWTLPRTIQTFLVNAVVILLLSWILVYFLQVRWYLTPLALILSNAAFILISSWICYYLINSTFNIIVICSSVIILVMGLPIFTSLDIGYSDNMARTVNLDAKETTNNALMPEINPKTKQLPVVNSNKTIAVIANNSLSQVKNANAYDIAHMRVQYYRGKLKYIVPLEFDGHFFKYLRYKEVPGYFIIDATAKDPHVKYIKQSLTYTPSAYIGHDVKRLMYKKVANKGLAISSDKPQLEITDDNKPYYVTTAYKCDHTNRLINFSQFWVVTVNALNGKTNLYRIQDKPKWLDIAVTPNIARSELMQYTTLRNGWYNYYGTIGSSKQGVSVPVGDVGTESKDEILTPISYKGTIYYFATLKGYKDEQKSVLGYAYINAATGKVHLYREKQTAMTPDSAMEYAKNRMRATKFNATMPLLYRIDGKPTWVVSMVDSRGAFMKYVYLKANGNGTQDTVAIGNNAKDTLNNYRTLFKNSIGSVDSSNKGKKIVKKGIVDRTARFDNDTVRFMLKGSKNVYSVSISKIPQIVFLRSGDRITITGNEYNNITNVTAMSTK